MNSFLIISLVISLIIGIVGYLATNNIILAVVLLLISFVTFFFFIKPIKEKNDTKIKRFKECYFFINTFIVSLSIKENITSAYESTIEAMPDDFVKQFDNVNGFEIGEKLDYLNKYFRFHFYSLFIDIINIYLEQGGDILNMSHYLTSQISELDEYIISCQATNKKTLVDFIILWSLTLGIMAFLRFALSQFFNKLTSQLLYTLGVGAILLFALFSFYLAFKKMTNIKIKGWDEHEKL